MFRKIRCVLICLFVAFCSVLIVKQHIFYPQPVHTQYGLHDVVSIGPLSLQVENVETYSVHDFSEMYQLNLAEKNLSENDNVQVIMVSLSIENTGTDPEDVDVTSIQLSTLDCMDSLEFISYKSLNPDYIPLTLEPDQKVNVLLPYIEFGTLFGVKQGNLMDTIPLQLCYKLYPEKITVRLNDLW